MVKVERSYPAPKSLEKEKKKSNGSYREQDVIERLMQDFNGKCYICNMGELTDIQVEHLRPHKNKDIDLKFDWDNLFLVCPHCNGVKSKEKYSEIIDCCKSDPEEFLEFIYNSVDLLVESKTDKEIDIVTADLICSVFNEKNTGIRIYTCEARFNKLTEEMNAFYKMLEKYENNNKSKRMYRTLSGFLKRESQFSAFKRNYIRKNIDKYESLKELVS